MHSECISNAELLQSELNCERHSPLNFSAVQNSGSIRFRLSDQLPSSGNVERRRTSANAERMLKLLLGELIPIRSDFGKFSSYSIVAIYIERSSMVSG